MIWVRAMGLTGGPWELGIVSSIIFFTLLELEKDLKNICSFFYCNLFLILTGGRANFLAFNLACLVLLLFHKNISFPVNQYF